MHREDDMRPIAREAIPIRTEAGKVNRELVKRSLRGPAGTRIRSWPKRVSGGHRFAVG